MAVQGADVDKLSALGGLFESRAAVLGRLQAEASQSVQLLDGLWQGPDAGQFRQQWAAVHRPNLSRAAVALGEAAATVRRNAAQQVTASTADGAHRTADGGRGGAGAAFGPGDGPGGNGPAVPDSGPGTVGAPILPGYHFGDTGQPFIHFDNGFLQNPDDPDDPNPMPTRPPTRAEKDYYESEVTKAEVGDVLSEIPGAGLFNDKLALEDGIEAYHHFLTGDGEPRTFDYASFLDDDQSGQVVEHNALGDAHTAADEGYRQLVAAGKAAPGEPVTFELTSDPISVGGDSFRYPYPDDENWQKAIGGHSMWTATRVTYTPQPDGTVKATATVTLNAIDRYNFNPGQQDIATAEPDSVRGVLEESGLAHQYTQTGTRTYEVSWNQGDPVSDLTFEPAGSR